MRHRFSMLFRLAILGLFVTPAAFAQQGPSDLFTDARTRAVAFDVKPGRAVVRQRPVTIDFRALTAALPFGKTGKSLDAGSAGGLSNASSSVLRLNLFADVQLPVVFERTEGNRSGSRTWIGRVEGVADSSVTLVVKEGVMTGNITIGGRIYQVGFAGNGVHMVREIDQSRFPPEAEPGRVANPPDAPLDTAPFQQDDILLDGDSSQMDGRETNKNLDILVVYTPAAKNGQGGQTAIETLIDLAISESNIGYTNSGINQRLSLVHIAEVDYTESGDIRLDRDRLQDPSDRYMDDVHPLRDTYNADLVTLITDNGGGYCGISYIMETVATSFEDYAFNVTAADCATGYYSFAHELGHIMGARHDWFVDITDNSPYTYNHGYVNTTASRRSVMAYGNACGNCLRLNNWSNPDDGPYSPWGEREGLHEAADNRKTLNNTGFTVANFRVREDKLDPSREFDSGATPTQSNDGIVFDLRAKKAITIHGFAPVFQNAETVERLEIYYREGPYSGHETDPAAWKLAGSANDVDIRASPEQTHIPIDLDISLPAGSTYAFYVTTSSSVRKISNGDGNGEGNAYEANDALELLTGRSLKYPFLQGQANRVFAGTIYHSYTTEGGDLAAAGNPNNLNDGIMFDIVAKDDIVIHGFSPYLVPANGEWAEQVEVWYRPGTHVGYEYTPADWTLVGAVQNVVGTNGYLGPPYVQNRVPLEVSVPMKAGETYAFYITTNNVDALLCKIGTGLGDVSASNEQLEVLEGTGKQYSFGISRELRAYSGTVHYAYVSDDPVTDELCFPVKAVNGNIAMICL